MAIGRGSVLDRVIVRVFRQATVSTLPFPWRETASTGGLIAARGAAIGKREHRERREGQAHYQFLHANYVVLPTEVSRYWSALIGTRFREFGGFLHSPEHGAVGPARTRSFPPRARAKPRSDMSNPRPNFFQIFLGWLI